MNHQYRRPLLGGGHVGPTSDNTHHQHTIFIHDDDDDDVSQSLFSTTSSGDCGGYLKPFMLLDMIWNMSFVFVSVFVLLTSVHERPCTPLRLWILGYALQCFLHVGFVWVEYQRWNLYVGGGGVRVFRLCRGVTFSFTSQNSITKKLESINTIVSSVWWVFGFYWMATGGQLLLQDSPRLYWLAVVFLALDVFFIIFCIAMACMIFLLLFCCFPMLATVAYAMSIAEGASETDIRSLPKYLYRQQCAVRIYEIDKKEDANSTALSKTSISTAELVLQPEDSECCICLYKYVDGTELCTLPCNHHFHHECISKWLRINATCPLCKFNILGADTLV